MCRAFAILDIKNKPDYNKYVITMNYIVNSNNSGNNDGYFLAYWNTEDKIKGYKSLDYNRFFDWVVKHKKEIIQAKTILGHLRMATTPVNQENIHGWNKEGYYCCHNGVFYNEKKTGSDSNDFFQKILCSKPKNFEIENIAGLLSEEFGYGSIFAFSNNNKFIGSKKHKTNLHYINNNLIVVNSNDDIHKFNGSIVKTTKRTRKYGCLYFTQTTEQKFILKPKIKTDFVVEKENFVLEFDKNNVPLMEKPLKEHEINSWEEQQQKKELEEYNKCYKEDWEEQLDLWKKESPKKYNQYLEYYY